MKDILDQMEEHIAAIRNLQRHFDFHSKRLEKLMLTLNNRHLENSQNHESGNKVGGSVPVKERRNSDM